MKKLHMRFTAAVFAVFEAFAAALILFSMNSPQASAVVFSAEADPDTGSGGKIEITVENRDLYGECSVSIDGGISYTALINKRIIFGSLKAGSYNICVKADGEVSGMKTLSVSNSSGNSNTPAIAVSADCTAGSAPYLCELHVTIDSFDSSKRYMISLDGGTTWRMVKEQTTVFRDLLASSYDVLVKDSGNSSHTSDVMTVKAFNTNIPSAAGVKAESLLQNPELPTGCEITSLAMALRYLGFDISKTELADSCLEKGAYRESDFRSVFVGDPRLKDSYGCYSSVIRRSADSFLTSEGAPYRSVDLTGCDISAVYGCIADGYPVIVWATIEMEEPRIGRTWIDKASGKSVTWISGEHCLLMTGYDLEKGIAYINDPLAGAVTYDLDLFKERFLQMGSQAVVICPSEEEHK